MSNKKILALLLGLVLLITPFAAIVPTVAAESEPVAPVGASTTTFTPRLSAPGKSNAYYYSNKNIFYSIGYGMPNCTAYAWGRAYEILKTKPNLSVDSAHYWWGYNKTNKYYPYGQTPKLGAIACWNNPYGGHVAVVEKIENGTVTLSHSAWGGPNFYTTTYSVGDKSAGIYSSGWSFYGYIYILDGAAAKPTTGDIYRITSSDGVNLRKGAGTSYTVLGAIPYNDEITVTEYKVAGGYTWGKTTYNGQTGWCVLDYAKLILDNPTPALPGETKPTTAPTTVATEPATPPAELPTLPPDPVETLPSDPAENPDVSETLPEESKPAYNSTKDESVTAPDNSVSSPDENHGGSTNLIGDVNGDGKVNILDVTTVQKHLAKMEVAAYNPIAADVNRDGKVNVADVSKLQKILAKI
ncbi:MAG: dockerin type I domain-containing protein [Eubacteriales bacterium]|nr:dockerin type I domain-containing protein [Eubacteriales bacterium]